MDNYSLMCECRGDESGQLVKECHFHKVVRERDHYRDALEWIDKKCSLASDPVAWTHAHRALKQVNAPRVKAEE